MSGFETCLHVDTMQADARHSRTGGNPRTLTGLASENQSPWIARFARPFGTVLRTSCALRACPAFAGMTTKKLALAAAMLACLSFTANAQDLLIHDATVHTATTRGTLQHADVLVHDGRIAAVGPHLTADNAQVVEANGAPL